MFVELWVIIVLRARLFRKTVKRRRRFCRDWLKLDRDNWQIRHNASWLGTTGETVTRNGVTHKVAKHMEAVAVCGVDIEPYGVDEWIIKFQGVEHYFRPDARPKKINCIMCLSFRE